MSDDKLMREGLGPFAQALLRDPQSVLDALDQIEAEEAERIEKAEYARRRRKVVVVGLLAFIAALLVAGVACADELVREGRYVLVDDADTVISEHNELHVAIREGQAWSRENDGRTFRIDPPRYRGSANPAEIVTPPVVDPPPASNGPEIRVAPGDNLDAAIAELQPGGSLLFQRGRTFDLPADHNGDFRWWRVSGIDADQPTTIGAYGDGPPPVLRSNGRGVFASIRASHLVIRDLHLLANDRDAEDDQAGLVINAGDNIQLINLTVEGFKDNILLSDYPTPPVGEPTITNVVIDGCRVLNAHCDGAHSQGLYAKQVRGLSVTGCVFDHNGWSDADTRTGFNHNVYLSMCDEVGIVGNVLANGSNMGVKLRSDYEGAMSDVVVEGNLFIGNLTGITASGDDNHDRESLVIRDLVIRGNVFTDHGGELPGGAELGHAVKLRQVGGATVDGNLLIDLGHEINRQAFNVDGLLEDVTIADNVLERWPMARGREPLTSNSGHDQLTLRGNRIEEGVATRRPKDYQGDPLGMVAWLMEGVGE